MAGVAACNVASDYHIDLGGVSAFQGGEQVRPRALPTSTTTSRPFQASPLQKKESARTSTRGTLEDGDLDEHATSFERAF